jgi:class 3 adenylate cyclase/tetratricopeptide (TPR) repeat protein
MSAICTQCARSNDDAVRLCTGCGAALPRVCGVCAAINDADASFCSRCGARIDDEALARAREREEYLAGHLPRDLARRFLGPGNDQPDALRQVTILFVDLVQSTEIVHALGAEGMADLLDELLDAVARAVERLAGTVAELAGDGAMCIFGAPMVHEDDPERAVRAALSIERLISDLQSQHVGRGNVQLQVRMGLHTGTVVLRVAGQAYRLGYSPVGDVVHLTARLQSAARPAEILVSQATRNLTASLFHFGEPQVLTLKGFQEPQVAYPLRGEKDTAQRRMIDASDATFVGRAADLATLQSLVGDLTVGLGSVLTLWGEAGIGKSRLLAEVRSRSLDSIIWMEGRGLSYAQNKPYSIIGQLIRRASGINEADPESVARDTLRKKIIDVCGEDQVEVIYPFVATALGLRVEGYDSVLGRSSSELLQSEIFRALRSLITALAQRSPLVMVLEDLHWSDRASIAALDNLLPLAEEHPVLYALVARPDADAPSWGLRQKIQTVHAHVHTDVNLGPLSPEASSDLAMKLLGTDHLPVDLQELFLEKTEGVPLFVEELAKSLIEQGALERNAASWRLAVSADELRIPDTVQGIILARFDHLSDELKQVLQAAAVLGPQVAYRVLAGTVDSAGQLASRLRELQRRGFLRQTRRRPESVYVFRHALIRDVAYRTMRRDSRAELHARVGATMERVFGDRLSEFQTIIAEHYLRAEVWDKAADYLLRAGDESARLHAHAEARLHYARATEALVRLPVTDANARRRIDTIIKRATVSYTAEAPQAGLARLSEGEALIGQVVATGDPADEDRLRLAWIHYWLARIHYIGGNPIEAMEYYKLALAAGQELDDVQLVTTVSAMMGGAMAVGGQFGSGRLLLAQALPVLEAAGAWREWCLSSGYLGSSMAACGDYHEGIAMAARAVDRAAELRGSYLMAMTRILLSAAYIMNEQMHEVRAFAQQAMDDGARSGEKVILYLGLGFRGWAEGRLGAHAAAAVSMARSADVGAELGQPMLLDDWFAAARADIAFCAGDTERATTLAEEAIAMADRGGSRFSGGIAHRVWAQALAAADPPRWDAADEHLTTSIDLLESGDARLPAAHTRMVWARICRARGDHSSAREQLTLGAAQFRASGLVADLRRLTKGL